MRELRVLLLILVFSGVASAGVIDLSITSINGMPITPTKEITPILAPTLYGLSITFTASATEYLFGIQSFININNHATLDWTSFNPATWDPVNEVWIYDDLRPNYDPYLHVVGQESGKTYIVEGALDKGKSGAGQWTETWIVKDIQIYYDAMPPATLITLSNRGNGSVVVDSQYNRLPFTYGNGVFIHTIPEPMTLMLLGLGSLFLVRRKK